MGKAQIQTAENELLLNHIKKTLGDKCACFVLITCTEPSAKGNMQVEMNYEGEESLAAFLVENAAQVFEQQMVQKESK